jgi:hypothetical protein
VRARLADVLATNPPTARATPATASCATCLSLRPKYAAFFLPITFLASIHRDDILDRLFCGLALKRVLVIAWRLTLKPRRVKLKNSGVVTYAWFIWERAKAWAPAVFHRLYRVAA